METMTVLPFRILYREDIYFFNYGEYQIYLIECVENISNFMSAYLSRKVNFLFIFPLRIKINFFLVILPKFCLAQRVEWV